MMPDAAQDANIPFLNESDQWEQAATLHHLLHASRILLVADRDW